MKKILLDLGVALAVCLVITAIIMLIMAVMVWAFTQEIQPTLLLSGFATAEALTAWLLLTIIPDDVQHRWFRH